MRLNDCGIEARWHPIVAPKGAMRLYGTFCARQPDNSGAASPALRLLPLLLFLSLVLGLTTGCGRREYDQATPQATLDSLCTMIQEEDLGSIPELIRAEDDDMDLALRRTGAILDRLNELAQAIKESYPREVQDLLARAGAAVAGEATGGRSSARRTLRGEWSRRLQHFIVDPYGALEETIAEVAIVELDDQMAAVTIDGKPAFGVGLLMMKNADDDKWYFAIPTTIPWLNTSLPRTEAEWSIVQSMLHSVANGVDFVTEAVDEKRYDSLDDLQTALMGEIGVRLGVQYLVYQQALAHRPEPAGATGDDQ